ncbi:MAG TPA: flagellar export chaperone FliS [Gammaproteobacteria bacterium]|nr:flagellar export chaperone FliS [Gammaproteobacteria bacterium]
MSYPNIQTAVNQYKQVGVQSGLTDATPYRLVQMLMEGALERVSKAKGTMQRHDFIEKGRYITSAMSIIDGLRGSLDFEVGGEIAVNLDNLYEYMNRRLMEANTSNNPDLLDEVSQLMSTIKEGWDGVPVSIQEEHARSKSANA